MNKITNYLRVSGDGETFDGLIKKYIDEGWQPFGGICMVHLDYSFDLPDGANERVLGFEFAQAMVQYGDVINL